jgi:hypothetical protein
LRPSSVQARCQCGRHGGEKGTAIDHSSNHYTGGGGASGSYLVPALFRSWIVGGGETTMARPNGQGPDPKRPNPRPMADGFKRLKELNEGLLRPLVKKKRGYGDALPGIVSQTRPPAPTIGL